MIDWKMINWKEVGVAIYILMFCLLFSTFLAILAVLEITKYSNNINVALLIIIGGTISMMYFCYAPLRRLILQEY